jgi:hypothetical protein
LRFEEMGGSIFRHSLSRAGVSRTRRRAGLNCGDRRTGSDAWRSGRSVGRQYRRSRAWLGTLLCAGL